MNYRTFVVGFASSVLACFGLATIDEAQAGDITIGDQTCTQNYSWFDYYTGPRGTGEIYYSAYEPDGVTCFYSGDPSGGGYIDNGGGGVAEGPDPNAGIAASVVVPESCPSTSEERASAAWSAYKAYMLVRYGNRVLEARAKDYETQQNGDYILAFFKDAAGGLAGGVYDRTGASFDMSDGLNEVQAPMCSGHSP